MFSLRRPSIYSQTVTSSGAGATFAIIHFAPLSCLCVWLTGQKLVNISGSKNSWANIFPIKGPLKKIDQSDDLDKANVIWEGEKQQILLNFFPSDLCTLPLFVFRQSCRKFSSEWKRSINSAALDRKSWWFFSFFKKNDSILLQSSVGVVEVLFWKAREQPCI